jgi:hypothetical protein
MSDVVQPFLDTPALDSPALDSPALDHLADSFGQAVADNGDAFLVHVITTPDGLDVGILPTEGQAPSDMLLGTVAPDHWSALGVATLGDVISLDSGQRSGRASVVVLVARDGHVVSRVRQGDQVMTEPPASGITLDCLQRALGLPTAPAAVPVSHLLSLLWLDRVVRAARGRRQPLRWGQVSRLHPAVELAAAIPGVADTYLESVVEELDRSVNWDRLRQLVMAGGWPVFGITPEEAAWFDGGSLSRWVFAQWPSVPVLLAEVRRALPSAEARRCSGLLRRLGVDSA